jgi:hypothetical protein
MVSRLSIAFRDLQQQKIQKLDKGRNKYQLEEDKCGVWERLIGKVPKCGKGELHPPKQKRIDLQFILATCTPTQNL